MASPSEHRNGFPSCVKDGKLHEQLSDFQLSRRTRLHLLKRFICNVLKTALCLCVEIVSNYCLRPRDEHKVRISTDDKHMHPDAISYEFTGENYMISSFIISILHLDHFILMIKK